MTTLNLTTTTLNDYTVEDLQTIKAAALQHANDAGIAHLEQYGEQAYCGFAWVNIWDIKGKTTGRLAAMLVSFFFLDK